MKAISQIQVQIADGVSVSVQAGTGRSVPTLREDRLHEALTLVGEIAQAQGRGVALLFDEAHSVYDRRAKHQFPLGGPLSELAVHAACEDPQPGQSPLQTRGFRR